MEDEIVKMHDAEPRAGTFLIAQGFDREHSKVVRLIEKYKDRFLRLENNKRLSRELIVHKVPAKTAGRPVEEYLLNEKQTIFLGSLFRNTEIVLDFKERLANDFVEVKSRLLAIINQNQDPTYQLTRDTGKIVRKQATDQMQRFVEYSTEQGSKSANMYYSNITRMMNGMLFITEGKYKNLRNVMTTQQLMTVSSAEQIIDRSLRIGMDKKLFYKEVYKEVKANVMLFADLHGQSNIIDEFLKINNEKGK